jgi:multimeric flavodoxin WrbA
MAHTALAIYGSPRKGGNTDTLLDRTLEGARAAGATVYAVYARDLVMSGCRECGGCDRTGECVVHDDMQTVYPLLEKADRIYLASPIFFYGITAQAKALIDRAQAMWSKRMLMKSPESRKSFDSGKGYLIAVGATKGQKLFLGVELTAKYFYDALDMTYEGGLLLRGLEKRSDAENDADLLEQAYRLGFDSVSD